MEDIYNFLKNSKNILAYSGGTDSNYLFYKLIEENISFDMIHVNYGTRDNSDKEEELCRNLAEKYNKKVFILKLDKPDKVSSFEKWARDKRYRFFEKIIKEYGYDNLITGHNLNDKVEWSLMQFTRGCGFHEFFGMDMINDRDNYTIVRPLLNISKHEIMNWLETNNCKYFYDESNDDKSYLRNLFRHDIVNYLVYRYEGGIKQSYKIMKNELNKLKSNFKTVYHNDDLYIFEYFENSDCIHIIDKSVKKYLKYVLSYEQREILKYDKEIVIVIDGQFYTLSFNNKYIFIGKLEKIKMDKDFKEKCRIKKIPNKIRPYIYKLDKNIVNNL